MQIMAQKKIEPMTQRKPRVLVMIPAGQRYSHDRIKIYDQPRTEYRQKYFNTGDMVVYDSIAKIAGFC